MFDRDNLVFWYIGAGVIVLFVLVGMAINAENNKCETAGGHMIHKSAVGPNFGSNGGVTITDISFCVSADGRILF